MEWKLLDKIDAEDTAESKKLLERIESHPFNTEATKENLNEYDELIEGIHRILERGIWDSDTWKSVYKYYDYRNIPITVSDRHGTYRSHRHVDMWSIPNIGIISSAMHDYRHIEMTTKFRWDDEDERERMLGLYRETCKRIVHVFKELLEGREVSKMAFPKEEYGLEYAERVFEYARNPEFDNLWTLVKEIKKTDTDADRVQ